MDDFYDDYGESVESEPQEGDLVTDDYLNFYQDGRHVLRLQVRQPPRYVGERGTRTRPAEAGELSDAAMWRQLDAFMAKQRLWSNVWWVSDHGNAHLLQRPKRQSRKPSSRHTPGRRPRRPHRGGR